MFYCSGCATKQRWPEGFFKSRGICEVCGHERLCNDTPSALLPDCEEPEAPPAPKRSAKKPTRKPVKARKR